MARVTKAQEAQYLERAMKALYLKTRGRTLETIARVSHEEGWEPEPYNSPQSVWNDIRKAVERRRQQRNEAVDDHIDVELEKLDVMEEETWKVAEALHFVVNQGEVVYLEGDEIRKLKKKQGWAKPKLDEDAVAALERERGKLERQPLLDKKPVLDCMLVLLKIAERRSKLKGYDAPVKKQVEVTGGDRVSDAINAIASGLVSGLGTLKPALNRVQDVATGGSGETPSAPEAA